MDELIAKAAILHEALPYIRRFRGRVFVVKYGGNAMVDEVLKESFAQDVCLLRYIGIQVIVVHGGGPQITEALDKMGIESVFSGGLRVTDEKTMQVVEMVLSGRVNSDIVGLISRHGGHAIGLSGRDDNFIEARAKGAFEHRDNAGKTVKVDLGRVGRIESINPHLVKDLISNGFLPVIAPIGVDANGNALNVNADTAAGEIAAAVEAAKLVLMTDVEGVKDAKGNLIRSLYARHARAHIRDGTISGGMIPKVECALEAVDNGVEKVHIVDGRQKHALLLEIFTDSGVGTQIHRESAAAKRRATSKPPMRAAASSTRSK